MSSSASPFRAVGRTGDLTRPSCSSADASDRRGRLSYSSCLEKIARAAGGSYDRRNAAVLVTEELHDMLDYDQVFLLAPSREPNALCVEAAAPLSEASLHPGEIWDLGPQATRIFERSSNRADAEVEPYSAFDGYLSDAGFESWLALPLRPTEREEPIGLLGFAGGADRVCCESAQVLEPIASSVAAVLWRLEERSSSSAPGARPLQAELKLGTPYDVHDVEQMRALMNMAFGVAHSLGNIFSAILGNLYFLGERLEDSACVELERKLEQSTYAGIDMMRSLEKFAARPITGEMQPVDLSELAGDVVRLVQQVCIDPGACRGIRLRTHLCADCLAWGSAAQIREALINIIFNAIQALEGDGDIAVITQREGGHCHISVEDNGPGMTKEVCRRATEPFFTTRPGTHQGLGLSVTRGIVVAHRGQLTIKSQPGRGARVDLRLPCEPPQPVQAPEQLIREVLSDL